MLGLMPLVYAELLITGIFYDPDGVDTGFEWVELYNPTNESINLETYVLFKGNGDKDNDWTQLPQISGTLYPYSFFLIGESNVTQADFTAKLSLFNGPDAVALKSLDGEIVDLVGYGTLTRSEYKLGNSAQDVASGKSLSRKFTLLNNTYLFSQTQNNSLDWNSQDPNPRNSLYQYQAPTIQNTSVTIVVPQSPVIIQNITLSDDQKTRTGTQWSLVGKKKVTLLIDDDSDTFNASSVVVKLEKAGISKLISFQSQTLNDENTTKIVELTLSLSNDLSMGNYSLIVSIPNGDDGFDESNIVQPVEILASIGITICGDMELIRGESSLYRGVCEIKNIGNVRTKISMNLTFNSNFNHENYLEKDAVYTKMDESVLQLDAGELIRINVVTNISKFIKFGTYKGTLSVSAWAQS